MLVYFGEFFKPIFFMTILLYDNNNTSFNIPNIEEGLMKYYVRV